MTDLWLTLCCSCVRVHPLLDLITWTGEWSQPSCALALLANVSDPTGSKHPTPRELLLPFLEVVRSVETSGPITRGALLSVQKLLAEGTIDPNHPGAAEAVQDAARAVTSCRFEATDPGADEVVLAAILHVLLTLLRCPAGQLLANQDVCDAVRACFRIGYGQGGRECSRLLRDVARNTVEEMMALLFSQLEEMIRRLKEEDAQHRTSSNALDGPREEGSTGDYAEAAGSVPDSPRAYRPYNISCLSEMFAFVCSLISPHQHSEVRVHCLGIISTAIDAGGEAMKQVPELMAIIQSQLGRSCIHCAPSATLEELAALSALHLKLFALFGPAILPQVKAFIDYVLLPIAEGKAGTFSLDMQEVAVDAIVDFCRHTDFVCDVYRMYDCELTQPNAFELLVGLLSRSAFPVNSILGPIHLLSLEGLLVVMTGMQERAEQASDASASSQPPSPTGVSAGLSSENGVVPDLVLLHDSVGKEVSLQDMRKKKRLKEEFATGVEHFNRDPSKGFEYLQAVCLLPKPLTSSSVGAFLRHTPGLDKTILGEYLGEPDEFNVEVLKAFIKLFDVRELSLDLALRMFMESFRLPGEAQKISRILENFASHYHKECQDETFKSEDVVYVLCYSIIMLNTDQHNAQVKKKMTLEDFIRNNRKINEGEDLPREFLEDIFYSIATDEIRVEDVNGLGFGDIGAGKWSDVVSRSRVLASTAVDPRVLGLSLDMDMFAKLWNPAIAAISVVFDYAEDEVLLERALNGYLCVAQIAATYKMTQVIDTLIVSMCKFTSLLTPSGESNRVASFGQDARARSAALAVFTITNRFGDYVRSGWWNIVDCVTRLYTIGALPPAVTEQLDEGMDSDRPRIAGRPAIQASKKNSSASSLLKQLGLLLSLEGSDDEGDAMNPAESEAVGLATECIEACHIGEIFADSKFLQGDALVHLARALVWAADAGQAEDFSDYEQEVCAVFCLQILVGTALRNRDRIHLLWPLLSSYFNKVLTEQQAPVPVIEHAALELLHLSRRLLPYKEDIAEELLSSLNKISCLEPKIFGAMAPKVAAEIVLLLKGSVKYIHSKSEWETICSLLTLTASYPQAYPAGLEALSVVVLSEGVRSSHFEPLLESIVKHVESPVATEEQCVSALELMGELGMGLVKDHTSIYSLDDGTVEFLDHWGSLIGRLGGCCIWARIVPREQALNTLHKVLAAAEPLSLPASTWRDCLQQVILRIVDELTRMSSLKRPANQPSFKKSLRLASSLMCKVFLQYLTVFSQLDDFTQVWLSVLSRLEDCLKLASHGSTEEEEELAEAIPQHLKNLLLVMSSQGILVESREELWDSTWMKAQTISPSFSPSMLSSPA